MAAVPDVPPVELTDLWQLRLEDLDPTLEEEIRTWRSQLDWDFRASADLVRRFVEVHALSGYALAAGSKTVGYAYFVCEEHKGLIGDLFIRSAFRTPENENLLLGAVVERLMRTRHVRRIESQLMLTPMPRRIAPAARYARTYTRNFMVADMRAERGLPERQMENVVLDHWHERRQDDAAQVIAAAYRGHIDGEINDQYRTPSGARRFLFNIIQYPGCGAFFERGSWLAMSRETSRVCGLSLTSMVSEATGHVTQICVTPAFKGKGLGYELLRRSMVSLAQSGAVRISLTVTAANQNAVALYERMGFGVVRQFPAMVWEGW